MVLAQ